MFTFATKQTEQSLCQWPLDVIKEYDHTIHDELDLRMEAANGARMGANFEDSDLIYVPRFYWDYTQQNILVMERIYGTSIRDIATLKANGYVMQQLSTDGVITFFTQACHYSKVACHHC